MTIQRLTKALTQKIAAGEVIDRPASVVKELIENAIDARSESIEVSIVSGGKEGILVRDDGVGMTPEDLKLSIERYATSKISTEEDLYVIQSLGFRGEALASVAAVSKLRIVTRAGDQGEAHELTAEDGRILGIRPAARRSGTTVEVRDLFYNVPVRAKFLGTSRTEFLHVNRAVQRMAILHPEIGWNVTHGDREVLAAPRVHTLLERIGQMYGADVVEAMIPVELTRDSVVVSGFISRPDLRRGNRRDQMFSVNGRTISDRGLSFVLSSAYRGILRPGSFPIAMISLQLPPEEVDVNIHPRKEEVRFSHPRQIQDAVSAALQRALSSREVVIPMDRRPANGSAEHPSTTHRERVDRERQRQLGFELTAERGIARTLHEAEKVSVHSKHRVLGQVHNTYLVVETPEGMEIIDQHIAHERILYERIRGEWPAGVVRQVFLLPARVEVSFEQANILSSHTDELAEIGVVLDEFGGGTFLIREFPQVLANHQSMRGFQEVIEGLADVLAEEGNLTEALYERLFSQLACSAAIKAGDSIPLIEAQELVDELMQMENPYTCPHGRPVIVRYDKIDLDKRFKRV